METAIPLAADKLYSLAGLSSAPLEVEADGRGVGIRLLEPRVYFYHSFSTGPLARRARQSNQALLRACNNRARDIESLLDLTAGWGADGLTLARHGQRVTMLERDELIFAILGYSLACLAQTDAALAARLDLVNADARAFLDGLDENHAFDCIYLDPMFPPHKSGAKPAGEMQILQALTENRNIEASFELARASAHKRVVVKRPARAPTLTGDKPDIVYREKSIRFDVYLSRT